MFGGTWASQAGSGQLCLRPELGAEAGPVEEVVAGVDAAADVGPVGLADHAEVGSCKKRRV
jgi:hypothetical protein